MMSTTFIQERIAANKAMIIQYEDAILSLSQGTVISYTLDTGQTKQTVEKRDLSKLQTDLDGLYNRLSMLEARCNGGNSVTVRPGW